MTRIAFRRFWMVVILVLGVSSYLVYGESQQTRADIDREVRNRQRMQVELNSGSLVAKALEEFDGLVMNEHESTMLSVLRYLGYEQSPFEVRVSGPSKVTFAGTKIFSRKVTVKGEVPYRVALSEIDRIYNSKKIVIHDVSLKPGSDYGDSVSFEVSGIFYGIDKGGRK